ncbi:unnamed protein product [Dibothriocephalus latus]|uniref:Uncharacterized protein n=1 Tax=Dibothriocephalus latus TaxID=60516 RepID=A0A3P6SW21_DIBLA|nr:unnamed protein product [Dibothriocephalus latus]
MPPPLATASNLATTHSTTIDVDGMAPLSPNPTPQLSAVPPGLVISPLNPPLTNMGTILSQQRLTSANQVPVSYANAVQQPVTSDSNSGFWFIPTKVPRVALVCEGKLYHLGSTFASAVLNPYLSSISSSFLLPFLLYRSFSSNFYSYRSSSPPPALIPPPLTLLPFLFSRSFISNFPSYRSSSSSSCAHPPPLPLLLSRSRSSHFYSYRSSTSLSFSLSIGKIALPLKCRHGKFLCTSTHFSYVSYQLESCDATVQ